MFTSSFYTKILDKFSIVAVTDTKGVIIYANDKFCEISKYQKEELIGATHRIIRSNYHPQGFFKEMWQTISRGRIWRGEICNKAKDGSLYWVESFIVPETSPEGKPYRYYSFRIDITERKKREEEIAQHNKILEEIAFTQSHEVRRPVANILGLVSLIDKQKISHDNLELIEHLEKSTQELDKVIHKILDKTYI